MKFDPLVETVLIGLGATFVMDLWAVFLNRAFAIPLPNYCFIGRWLRHMANGTFIHPRIAAATQQPAECPIGWIAHYTIGALFALPRGIDHSPMVTGPNPHTRSNLRHRDRWLSLLHHAPRVRPWTCRVEGSQSHAGTAA